MGKEKALGKKSLSGGLSSSDRHLLNRLGRLIDSKGRVRKEIRSKLLPKTSAASSSSAAAPRVPEMAFGKAAWKRYYDIDVGVEPALPSNIEEILSQRCPFDFAKRVGKTHLLTLIPEKADDNNFTLNLLRDLIQGPKKGHPTQYGYYNDYVRKELGEKKVNHSYWVLMTREIIPESRGKAYEDQKKLVATHAARVGVPYVLPTALEAAISVLMEHVRSGTMLLPEKPRTYTRCLDKVNENQWPVAIGGFAAGGLYVFCILDEFAIDDIGVCGARKF